MNEILAGIRWRLVGWNLLVLTVILVFLGAVVYLVLSDVLLAETDRGLATRAEAVIPRLERGDHQEKLHLDEEDSYLGGAFYLLIDARGQILSNPQRLRSPDGRLPISNSGTTHYENLMVAGEPLRIFVRPVSDNRDGALALVVGQSAEPQQEAIQGLLLVLVGGAAAGIALSLVGAWFLSGRALVPIRHAFRRQQQFVADASHELRTPLTVLHTATDLLDRHRAEPLEANGELFDDARREIRRMERLVGDLLTLARSDLGEFQLATGEVDIGVLASGVVARMKPLAEENGVGLDCTGQGQALMVDGDPDRLEQVLMNVLDNALKYTPAGGSVVLRLGRQGPNTIIEVVDSGKGVPPEHLPRIFDRFYRVDKARSRKFGGTGLGLAIARSLVEAHGGRLSLESRLGTGTSVTISLPLVNSG